MPSDDDATDDQYRPSEEPSSDSQSGSDADFESEEESTDDDVPLKPPKASGGSKAPTKLPAPKGGTSSGKKPVVISSDNEDGNATPTPANPKSRVASDDGSSPIRPGRKRALKTIDGSTTTKKLRKLITESSLLETIDPCTIFPPIHTIDQPPALRLLPSSDTPILNKWIEALPTLSIKEWVTMSTKKIKLDTTQFTPLGDMPDLPGRKFTHDVKRVDIEVNWDPAEGEPQALSSVDTAYQRQAMKKYRKTISTWDITVRNVALPKLNQKSLRVFPQIQRLKSKAFTAWEGDVKKFANNPNRNPREPPDNEKWVVSGGPLDTAICPTIIEARKVADEVCRLLAKIDIDESEFPDQVHLFSHTRTSSRALVELLSLRALRHDFDFRHLRYIFRGGMQKGCYYCLHPSPNNGYAAKRKDGPQPLQYEITVPVLVVNNAPKYKGLWPVIQILDNLYTQEGLDALPAVPQSWGFRYRKPTNDKMAGKELLPVESMMKLFNYMSWQLFGCVGSKDALQVASRTLVDAAKERKTSSYRGGPFKDTLIFHNSMHGGRIRISPTVAETISGAVPQIHTQLPASVRALAMQSALTVFAKGHGQIRMIEELIVSIEELRLGKSILSRETYCQCGDDEAARDDNMHYCMFCLQLMVCSRLAWTPDGRLVCQHHFKNGLPPPDKQLERRVYCKVNWCERNIVSPVTLGMRSEMREYIISNCVVAGLGFRDAYGGKRADNLQLKPASMSLDAIFPIHKARNAFFIHHPGNICLTTEFMNRLKGDDLPIILPAASEAMTTKGAGKYLLVLEHAFDHYTMIRLMAPLGKEDRLRFAPKAPSNWWPGYQKMMMTGVYNGSPPIYHRNWRTFHPKTSVHEHSWNANDISRLNNICKEIELSASINPKKLKLPRGPPGPQNMPGAPWIWNPTHMFSDHSWKYLAQLFSTRFERMDEVCDWRNDHSTECSETLFLACVVMWFLLDGGKDEILGLRMTVFIRHPLRFSIGRLLQVDPGSVMRTGWTVRHPHSLSQYEDERRTITMEAWIMNRAKWCYPINETTVACWTQLLREVPKTSKFWGPYPPDHKQRSVCWPKSWKTTRMVKGVEEEVVDTDSLLEECYESHATDPKLTEEDNADLKALESEDLELPDDHASDDEPTPDTTPVATHESDVDFMLSISESLPEELQQRYNEIVLRWEAAAREDLTKSAEALKPDASSLAEDPEMRRSIFVAGIITLLTEYDHETFFTIDELLDLDRTPWETLAPGMRAPFTEDEILEFCTTLDNGQNLSYRPHERGFIYKF